MIEVKDLVKSYGPHMAVDHVSFRIEDGGGVYGFLGPNGAGKSTTMNIMTGYLAATDGQVLIDGVDIFEDPMAARRCIGYLPEQPPVYPDMTPGEYLKFAAELKGVPRELQKEQLDEIMDTCGVTEVKDRLIRHLSKGYRQRVGLAQALLGYPDILILDEPTVGLDPKQIIEIRELIRELGKTHTVILSSHILSEVSAVCDHVLILSHGKLMASDTPENLSRLMSGAHSLSLTVRGTEEEVRAALSGLAGIESLRFSEARETGAVQVQVECAQELDLREDIFYALARVRLPLLSMSSRSLSLEDVFLELTEEDSGGEDTEPRESGGAETGETENAGSDPGSPETAETGEKEVKDHDGDL